MTKNAGICEAFPDYFHGLSTSQFDSYLVGFPLLKAAESEVLITESGILDALKLVSLSKSPGLNGLPYEVYLG